MSNVSTLRLILSALVLCAILFALSPFIQTTPPSPTIDLAAAAAANTRTNAATGVAAGALSYCAHWYSRDGTACIGTGTAGDLVSVSANDSGGLSQATSNCQRSGCKIALYCECMSAGDVQKVKDIYSAYVARFPNIMLPIVEVDGIRDIPGKDIEVAQALGTHGLKLVLKNSNAVQRYSPYTPVNRVIYEDIGRSGSYLNELKALASSNPTLLITGMLHQGSYAPNSGGTAYPGTSAAEAQAIFSELQQFKNVELFYGTPSGFQKIKPFDGAMNGIAREEGVIGARYTPPPFNFAQVPLANGLAQSATAQQPTMSPSGAAPASTQPFQYLPTNITSATSSTSSTANNIGSSVSSTSSIIAIQNIAYPDTSSTTPAGASVALINALKSPQSITVSNDIGNTQSQPSTNTGQINSPSTFTSTDLKDDSSASTPILTTLYNALINLLKNVLSFFRIR